MSNATELMRRTLETWDNNEPNDFNDCMEEIRAFLAAEPEANEHSISGAIAFTNDYQGGRCTVLPSNPAMVIPAGIPLYTRPEPARKPMTEDAEDEAFNSASKYAAWLETENRMLRESRKPITKREMLTWYDELRPKSVADFVLGVRFAERYHGIGGDDD